MCDDLWMRRTEERKETSACRIEWKSAFALHDFWLWFMFLAYSHFCEQVAAFEILNGWMNAMQWRKNLINCSIRISNSFTLKTLHKQKLQRYVLLETVEKKRVHTKRGCSRLSKLIQWCDSTLVLRTCDNIATEIQHPVRNVPSIFAYFSLKIFNELGHERLLPRFRCPNDGMPGGGESIRKYFIRCNDASTHLRQAEQRRNPTQARTWAPVSPYCFHLVYQSFIKRIDASGGEKRPQ